MEVPEVLFSSDRHFQVWDFNVSHKQLLIRSPRSPDLSMNVDIVFWLVEYLAVASMLDGLVLHSSTIEEAAHLKLFTSLRDEMSRIFRLESGEKKYFVAAAACWVQENQLDIFDSSLIYPSKDRTSEEYGRVLWRSPRSDGMT